MNSKSILACVFVACVLTTTATGQINNESQSQTRGAQNTTGPSRDPSSPVEVKNDRFGGATTVRLKPQLILESPNHQLEISAETKLGGGRQTGVSELDEKVQITIKSQSKDTVDFGDKELHFLVDGKPVKVGEVAGGGGPYLGPDKTLKPGFRISKEFFAVFTLNKLRQIAGGRIVEMRLGPVEVTLSDKVLKNLRLFVAAAPSRTK